MKRKKYRYVVARCAKRKSERHFIRLRGSGEETLRVTVCALAPPERQFGTKAEAIEAAAYGNKRFSASATFKVYRVERVL